MNYFVLKTTFIRILYFLLFTVSNVVAGFYIFSPEVHDVYLVTFLIFFPVITGWILSGIIKNYYVSHLTMIEFKNLVMGSLQRVVDEQKSEEEDAQDV